MYVFFFFKQKTAYEMLISDWSSDVCSSDLVVAAIYWMPDESPPQLLEPEAVMVSVIEAPVPQIAKAEPTVEPPTPAEPEPDPEPEPEPEPAIGRASCRERVCEYVEITVGAGS